MKFESLSKTLKTSKKKYKIVFSEPKLIILFGSKNSSTYLDHKDKTKRTNYLNRHKVREDWTKVNPGSLSALILWGDSTNLNTNLNQYLKKFNITK
jgi:hypothetical protein